MRLAVHSSDVLKSLLEKCGYTGTRLKQDYTVGSLTVPLAGFATKPWDFDSACIAVMDGNGDSEAAARSCRGMGAPIVWVQHAGMVDWWVQHASQPTLFVSEPVWKFAAIVRQHKDKLDPLSVYRGKTIARVDRSRQLDFVDAGLLPLLREEAGKKLHGLVEAMTRATLRGLGGGKPTKERLRAVFTAVFRLLAGKILKDKDVHGFKGLDLSRPADVLSAVGRHYKAGQADISITANWRAALTSGASLLSSAGSFGVVSPETLAYVYEHTLVTKALRKQLGIHATPPWLVDYMVWQLYDWIREIPVEDRHVFEPACGHAPFLLSAMRLLRLEMQDQDETEVHRYLKTHIHGVEIDDFAREIARLSLTLADIPNPNGWDLRNDDMYATNVLQQEAAKCRVLLCNPPYEQFDDDEKEKYAKAGFPVNRPKAIELMDRTLGHLPPRAVFAIVLPQGVLHSTEARASRELILRHFDIREICLFADKVFEEGEPESVVMLGRRRVIGEVRSATVRYRRVRENGVKRFAETYEPDSQLFVRTDRFESDPDKSFCVPDLMEVWDALCLNPKLSSVADIGQGFSFDKKGSIQEARRLAKRKTADAVPAFIDGHSTTNVWELPSSSWLSPSRTAVSPWRSGAFTGRPQVLLNRTRIKRNPWRLKAMLDPGGRAVKNNFLVVRPKSSQVPALLLWAVLNSPIANAFIASNTMKRDNKEGALEHIPLPRDLTSRSGQVLELAGAYIGLAERRASVVARQRAAERHQGSLFTTPEPTPDGPIDSEVREALLSLDAAVLRLYELPARLERQLLDYFRGHERRAVGCTFGDYYPADFKSLVPLHKYISGGYRRSTIDDVADRMKPGQFPSVLAALRKASQAFGEGD